MSLDLSAVDRSVLARSPLTSVICQVRFNDTPAAGEASTARALLEKLASLADGSPPKMEQITETSVNVSVGPNTVPAMAHQPTAVGWRIVTGDGLRTVTLMPNWVALESTSYDGWEDDFAPRLANVLAAVQELAEPVFEQRLGLRYINQITEPDVHSPEEWKDWLDEHLLGFIAHDEVGPLITYIRQQAILQLDDDVRCTLNHGFAPDPERGGALTYLLDFDLFREGLRPFDSNGIRETVDTLNTYALRLFQLSTDVALRGQLS
jgi:uncharacterized protein (TIGR04255 family)